MARSFTGSRRISPAAISASTPGWPSIEALPSIGHWGPISSAQTRLPSIWARRSARPEVCARLPSLAASIASSPAAVSAAPESPARERAPLDSLALDGLALDSPALDSQTRDGRAAQTGSAPMLNS